MVLLNILKKVFKIPKRVILINKKLQLPLFVVSSVFLPYFYDVNKGLFTNSSPE